MARVVSRHPQWKASDPYQDIPISVFTRSQWEDYHKGRFSIGAVASNRKSPQPQIRFCGITVSMPTIPLGVERSD